MTDDMYQRANFIRSMEGGVLPPALKKLTLVSAERSVSFHVRCAVPSRHFFTQSHNYMRRFHGLLLPQFLEELYLVPHSHGVKVAFFACILNLVSFTELQLHLTYRRCGG